MLARTWRQCTIRKLRCQLRHMRTAQTLASGRDLCSNNVQDPCKRGFSRATAELFVCLETEALRTAPRRIANQIAIARAAGVSVSTVSRALSNAPGISAERRSQIQRLAREAGYHGRG